MKFLLLSCWLCGKLTTTNCNWGYIQITVLPENGRSKYKPYVLFWSTAKAKCVNRAGNGPTHQLTFFGVPLNTACLSSHLLMQIPVEMFRPWTSAVVYSINWNMREFVLCRFVRSVGVVDQVSARKFLEAAKSTEDSAIFYAVFKFFEQRNQRIKGSSAFGKGE